MPEYERIPLEFREGHHPTVAIATRWFFKGLPRDTEFVPRETIEISAALRHAGAILHSIEDNEQHKIAGVAFLLNEWFSNIIFPDQDADN